MATAPALAPPTAAPQVSALRPRGAPRRRPTVVAVLVGLAVVAGLLARLPTGGPLWLDESLSVAIARLPLSQLPEALRHDGSPPLYYLLLHGWTSALGTSDAAVRSLSLVCSALALPPAAALGRRLAGPRGGVSALLLLSASPFAIRYASETRMYSLLLLEALLGGLALARALDRPTRGRLALVTLAAAALLYTHYWALFLLAALGFGVLWRARTDRTARRLVVALAGAVVLFAPQLPAFVYQSQHTGTPWAPKTHPGLLVDVLLGYGGPGGSDEGTLVGVAFLALATLGVLAVREPGRLVLRPRASAVGWSLLALSVGALVLALAADMVAGQGFVARYTVVALPAFVLLVARGVGLLPRRWAVGVLAVAVLAGTAAGRWDAQHQRTSAGLVAATLAQTTAPGDVVLMCPDQLAPALHRALARAHVSRTQLVYGDDPLGPSRVDWVDYAQHNAALDPEQLALRYDAAVGPGHRLAVVWEDGYRTFDDQCGRLVAQLSTLLGPPRQLLTRDTRDLEGGNVSVFDSGLVPRQEPVATGAERSRLGHDTASPQVAVGSLRPHLGEC